MDTRRAFGIWEVLRNSNFTGRKGPVVGAISNSKMLICGGVDEYTLLDDMLIFNIEAKTILKVTDAPFKLYC